MWKKFAMSLFGLIAIAIIIFFIQKKYSEGLSQKECSLDDCRPLAGIMCDNCPTVTEMCNRRYCENLKGLCSPCDNKCSDVVCYELYGQAVCPACSDVGSKNCPIDSIQYPFGLRLNALIKQENTFGSGAFRDYWTIYSPFDTLQQNIQLYVCVTFPKTIAGMMCGIRMNDGDTREFDTPRGLITLDNGNHFRYKKYYPETAKVLDPYHAIYFGLLRYPRHVAVDISAMDTGGYYHARYATTNEMIYTRGDRMDGRQYHRYIRTQSSTDFHKYFYFVYNGSTDGNTLGRRQSWEHDMKENINFMAEQYINGGRYAGINPYTYALELKYPTTHDEIFHIMYHIVKYIVPGGYNVWWADNSGNVLVLPSYVRTDLSKPPEGVWTRSKLDTIYPKAGTAHIPGTTNKYITWGLK